MTEPVTFCALRSGRIEAHLGGPYGQCVGVIEPWSALRGNGYRWQIKLNKLTPVHDAASIAMARRNICFYLAEWFEQCGERFESLVDDLRAQAEQERAVA